MAVEFELKFRAMPEQLDKVQQALTGHQQVIEMETTYYDTPGGALSKRKYTLRRRMENGVSVCTLKTPVERSVVSQGNGFLATLEMTEEETIPSESGKERIDTHHARGVTGDSPGRGEFEVNCDSIEAAIPELCKLSGVGLTDLTAGGVVKVAGARFTRVATVVVLPECTVEIALDRGVLLGGGREIELHELEVELKSGSREAATLYAMALAKTYGLTPEKFSKFRRALDLARGE